MEAPTSLSRQLSPDVKDRGGIFHPLLQTYLEVELQLAAMISIPNPRINLEDIEDKTIFLTGATGFLGLALVVKIIRDAPCKRLFLLVRGGERCVFNVRS